jgi:sec-independent protein translocase protein TatA
VADLGWQELVIILVIVMIIFGAGKLPEIAKSLGQGVRAFREESSASPAVGDSVNATANVASAMAVAAAEAGPRPAFEARDAGEI